MNTKNPGHKMKLHCYPVSPLRRTAHNCFFIPLEPANTTKTQAISTLHGGMD